MQGAIPQDGQTARQLASSATPACCTSTASLACRLPQAGQPTMIDTFRTQFDGVDFHKVGCSALRCTVCESLHDGRNVHTALS